MQTRQFGLLPRCCARSAASYTRDRQARDRKLTANGNVTRYAYDIADRLAKLTDPVGL